MTNVSTGDFEFLRQQQLAHQSALDKVKSYNKQEPVSFPRLDVPQDPTSLAINERIKASLSQQEQPPTLSPETVKGLEKLAEQMKKDDGSEFKELEDTDDYIYDDHGNRIRNIHNNRKRRKAIEERCSEMDIADLLVNQYVEQTVPIRPDGPKKLIVVFRSLSGHEDLLIKSIMAKEVTQSNQISSWYVIGKFSMLRLAAGLVKINGRALPDIKGPTGKPDEKLLLQKFDFIANYPHDILSDLDINYIWFSERVKELSVADNILNF